MVVEDSSPRRPWDLGQSLMLLGAAIFIFGIGLAYLFVSEPPQHPFSNKSPEVIHELVQNMSPSESWYQWQQLRQMGMNPQKYWAERNYMDKIGAYRVLWILLVPIFLVGLGFIVAGVVVHQSRRKRRLKASRAPN